MALKYAFAAFAIGAAGVSAQTSDNSNLYSVSDDYYNYGYTRRTTSYKTSMFWTATVRYMESVSYSPYTYAGETTSYDYTYTRTINPTVTPTVTATYTSSYKSSAYDVEVHEYYYPTGAVADSDLVSRTTYDYDATTTATTASTYTTTEYLMPVTMTAPTSCPTVFTVVSQATIEYIPSIVTPQLKPTSTEVSTTSGRSYVYEYATWYLTEGAAPFTSTDDYYYSYYIASCTPPPSQATSTRTSSTGGSGGSSSSGSDDDDSWYNYRTCYFGGCTSLKTWIIIVATVLPGIFLLGFLESWFWYTRLMKGKSAMRCGTICWILLSLWVLCFTRMQDARSKEDQKLLQQKWKEMPAGQKFKNWSWGFRRRYPVPLLGQFSKQTVGIVPEGQPLHPAMAQAPPGQVFYYGPPPPGAPGWQQGPNGGAPGYPMPAQGYPQQGGYYAANMPKDGVVVGSATVPSTGTATPPQAPQPAYHPPTSPPPNTQLPPQPQQAAPTSAPAPPAPVSAPPANVSEAPASHAREAPAAEGPAPTPAAPSHPQPTQPAPAKNETNDDLYS